MITYFRFLNPFKQYPGPLIAMGVCTLFFVTFNAASLWLVAPVLKVIFIPGTNEVLPVTSGGLEGIYESFKAWSWNAIGGGGDSSIMLPRLCIALIIMFALKNLFAYGQLHFVTYVEQRMVRDLRDRLFEHVARLPFRYYDRRPTGELMSNVMNDVAIVSNMFQRAFTLMLREPLTALTLYAILLSISWQLTLTITVIAPLFGFVYRVIGRSLKRKSARIQAQLGELSSHLQESITGARVVKAFGTENHEIRRFEKQSEALFRHAVRLLRLDRMASPVSETIGVVIIALVLLIGGQSVLAGQLLDAEDFMRFIVILFAVLAPVRNIGTIHNSLQVGAAAGSRLQTIFEESIEVLDRGRCDVQRLTKEIEFDRVFFRYDTSPDWILKDVSLAIRRNERIALVGRSGSGKTTLANLIPRFYDVQEGRILWDGVPTKDITLKSLRSTVSTVSQDVFLFNESVRYNIAYGLGEVSEDRLRDVLRRAQAEGFVSELPKGLETVIGERGLQLSGGQRQRLAIARALLRDAPILIFDEATSALDNESERLIQRALDELFRERTVIIIAHRQSSIQFASRVVLLDGGRISAVGTHAELQASSPLYATLMSLLEHEKPKA
ncbi:ABC transporter ATP-binding protein/permease [bacterium]|nr:ABC transporter ATP-binding protein/permease [bacterium]MBU1984591.1 ABC transporter ATP-binding protein/permease [bacterium]